MSSDEQRRNLEIHVSSSTVGPHEPVCGWPLQTQSGAALQSALPLRVLQSQALGVVVVIGSVPVMPGTVVVVAGTVIVVVLVAVTAVVDGADCVGDDSVLVVLGIGEGGAAVAVGEDAAVMVVVVDEATDASCKALRALILP
mmetsp:Transcript_118141/g.338905  ORF Transcript_118141/g.338905 Transcript_118141/m.338905 type:complete len:142 (-) Transcript_118141:631-1056(-)